jgi:hypothetical protein
MSEPETALDLMTYEQAKRHALALALATGAEIAIVHCGSGYYVAKRAGVAQAHYPQDIESIIRPKGRN